jgi:hypothetical protein
MNRRIALLACWTALVLGAAQTPAYAQGKFVVLLHGRGGGPGDFLIRNQASFQRAGFETIVASSAEAAVSAATGAQQRGRKVFLVGVSLGVPKAATAVASGVKAAGVVLVSGLYEEAMANLGSPGKLPPTLVVHHVADECPRTTPDMARRFVQWAGGKASIRWINTRGEPRGRACGARHAHGFFQQDGPAVSAIISFIRSR